MSNFSQIKTDLSKVMQDCAKLTSTSGRSLSRFILKNPCTNQTNVLFAGAKFVFLVVCFSWVCSGCVVGRAQPT